MKDNYYLKITIGIKIFYIFATKISMIHINTESAV